MPSEKEIQRAARRTKIVVIVGVVAYAIYDLAMRIIYGGGATISTIVGNWSRVSYLVAILLGGLLGHLLKSGDALDPQEYAIRITLAVIAAVIMFIVT